MINEVNLVLNKMRSNLDFQEDKIKQLCEDTSPETVLKILAHFHETLKVSASVIEAAITSGNMELISKSAHKIAGSAELLGFVSYGVNARVLSHTLQNIPDDSHLRDEVVTFLKRTQDTQNSILEAFPNLSRYLV